MSERRIEICNKCELSKKSKTLQFINGEARQTDCLYCTKCNCPINQKSLVESEFCKLNKW